MGLDLDIDQADELTTTITSDEPVHAPEVAPARQGDQHRPYCLLHNVLMTAYSSRDGVTRYRCPVPDCTATEKRAQPTSNVPREPMQCPHCAARAREAGRDDAPPVHLQVDYARSTYAMLLMVCPQPECRFAVRVARPDIVARSRLQARRGEQIGER